MGRAVCQGRLREWEEMLKQRGSRSLASLLALSTKQTTGTGKKAQPGMKRRKPEQTFTGGQC